LPKKCWIIILNIPPPNSAFPREQNLPREGMGRVSKRADLKRCSKMSSLPPRPGSVVVKHDVLLKTHYTPAYKEIFNQAKLQVEEKIQNATKMQTSNSSDDCASKFLPGTEQCSETV
jgi:hypothetical protein